MRDTVVSITFSSSDSLSSSSSPRGEKDERNETQRRTNETKRKELFATARPTSSAQTSHFCLPRPFRRRLRNDLRVNPYIFLHHRSTSRSRRRTHSARAPSFPSSLICDTKTKRETDELRTHAFIIRDRSDDAFGPISNIVLCSLVIIARRREAEEEPIARARASSSFPLSLLLARFTNENKRRKKHKVRELR